MFKARQAKFDKRNSERVVFVEKNGIDFERRFDSQEMVVDYQPAASHRYHSQPMHNRSIERSVNVKFNCGIIVTEDLFRSLLPDVSEIMGDQLAEEKKFTSSKKPPNEHELNVLLRTRNESAKKEKFNPLATSELVNSKLYDKMVKGKHLFNWLAGYENALPWYTFKCQLSVDGIAFLADAIDLYKKLGLENNSQVTFKNDIGFNLPLVNYELTANHFVLVDSHKGSIYCLDGLDPKANLSLWENKINLEFTFLSTAQGHRRISTFHNGSFPPVSFAFNFHLNFAKDAKINSTESLMKEIGNQMKEQAALRFQIFRQLTKLQPYQRIHDEASIQIDGLKIIKYYRNEREIPIGSILQKPKKLQREINRKNHGGIFQPSFRMAMSVDDKKENESMVNRF
jgi:hypothetical protein